MKIKLDSSYNFLVPHDEPVLRIGNDGDGGYVIPTKALTATSLISFGLGNNWTFEQQWLDLKPATHIHIYDGTVHPTSHFFTGTVRHFKENVTPENINIILAQSGNNAFLKMDIEGAEYAVIPDICKAKNLLGMAVEFHNLDFPERRISFKSTIESISDNYNIVHIHANNYGGINEDGLPHTLEISFLRKDLCSSSEKRYDAYLHDLDTPNALTSEEYFLYFVSKETE